MIKCHVKTKAKSKLMSRLLLRMRQIIAHSERMSGFDETCY